MLPANQLHLLQRCCQIAVLCKFHIQEFLNQYLAGLMQCLMDMEHRVGQLHSRHHHLNKLRVVIGYNLVMDMHLLGHFPLPGVHILCMKVKGAEHIIHLNSLTTHRVDIPHQILNLLLVPIL